MMRRIISLLLITTSLGMLFPNPSSAISESVVLPGFATFEYPKVVKIGKANCQKVYLDYQIDETLDINGAAIAIQIGNVKKKTLNGGTVWFGLLPDSGDLGSMPYIGRVAIQVCKKNWKFKTQKYLAIQPQTYDLYFGYGWYFADGTSSKAKEIRKITFIR